MAVFRAATCLFASLPLASIIQTQTNRVFVVHGGISDQTDLDYLKSDCLNRRLYERLTVPSSYISGSIEDQDDLIDYELSAQQLIDILWSDPIYVNQETGKIVPKQCKKPTGSHFNVTRQIGCLFGYDVSEKFCKKYSFSFLIRSHECRDKGFSQDHPKCFTLFSASNYLNSGNMGAVILMGMANEKKFQVYAYTNSPANTNSTVSTKEYSLLSQFKHLVQLNDFNLMPRFQSLDTTKLGHINELEWAKVLSNGFEISNEYLLLIKDLFCECDQDKVYYRTMFKKNSYYFRSEKEKVNTISSIESENYLMIVKSLFEIIDTNHDKHISLDEAKQALCLIGSKAANHKYDISEEESINFIKQFDVNCDNLIDLNEFYKAFFYDEFIDSTLSISSFTKEDNHHNVNNEDDDEDNDDGDNVTYVKSASPLPDYVVRL
jgi:Ca2+-binding EF-hand superfamily protein